MGESMQNPHGKAESPEQRFEPWTSKLSGGHFGIIAQRYQTWFKTNGPNYRWAVGHLVWEPRRWIEGEKKHIFLVCNGAYMSQCEI